MPSITVETIDRAGVTGKKPCAYDNVWLYQSSSLCNFL